MVGFGEIGLGGVAVLFLDFKFAICSKCERREDTGFCNTLSSRCPNYSYGGEELTMDVSSRFSSTDSSIVKTSKDKIWVR